MRKMNNVFMAGVLSFTSITSTALAVDRLVPSEYATIQAAVDAAQSGDTIRVSPGTYFEHLVINSKSITIESTGGVNSVTIDATSSGRCVSIEGVTGIPAVLRGLVFINGSTTDSGAGVLIQTSKAAVLNCRVQNNLTAQSIGCAWCAGWRVRGGGMAILNTSHVRIENTEFIQNAVKISFSAYASNGQSRGGGLYVESSNVEIIGGQFDSNESIAEDNTTAGCSNCNWPTTGVGAGICVAADGVLSAVGVTFVNQWIHGLNASFGFGAGVAVMGGTASLSKCRLQGNISNIPNNCHCGPEQNFGGACYVDEGGTLAITDCDVAFNTVANSSTDLGGALYNANGSISVLRSTFCSNSLPTISGSWDDLGENSIEGLCAPGCLGDISGNGIVNGFDLSALLGTWGTNGQGEFNCDIDHDGIVGGTDLAIVLVGWGPCQN